MPVDIEVPIPNRNTRICTSCARIFRAEPWRAGCDRCGNLVVNYASHTTYLAAVRRALCNGWYVGKDGTERQNRRRTAARRARGEITDTLR